jgi:hypothetical protein
VHADDLGGFPFGINYYALGDFTGDGLADVGAMDEDHTYYVIAGSKTPITDQNIADVATLTITNLEGSGVYAAPIGDANGDGFGDLWAFSQANDDSGIAIFFGGPGNEGTVRHDQAKLIITPGYESVFPMDVGDVNGDGMHDLAFMIYESTSSDTYDIGLVFGRKEWPATIALEEVDVLIPNVKGAEHMELEAPMRGDIDGDGMNELVLVSHREDWDKYVEAGVVRIFRGRADWPSTVDRDDYDLVFHGSTQRQGVGSWSWLVIADLNGDGMDDIVSSSYYHPTVDGTGTTFVFFGQPAP